VEGFAGQSESENHGCPARGRNDLWSRGRAVVPQRRRRSADKVNLFSGHSWMKSGNVPSVPGFLVPRLPGFSGVSLITAGAYRTRSYA
jgi:hypothetical protein